MSNRTSISEYIKHNKLAIVYKAENGYEVDLYEDDSFIKTIQAHEHSEIYASDIAENWCTDILTIGE
jgi:hypothetical protein